MLFRPHLGVEFKKPCTCRRELVMVGRTCSADFASPVNARWITDYCENHKYLISDKDEPKRCEYVLSVEEGWRFPDSNRGV